MTFWSRSRVDLKKLTGQNHVNGLLNSIPLTPTKILVKIHLADISRGLDFVLW